MSEHDSTSDSDPAFCAEAIAEAVSAIATHEMNRLWQAHGIVELAIYAMRDEAPREGPSISQALQAAADLIRVSIDALEPICTPAEVETIAAPRAAAEAQVNVAGAPAHRMRVVVDNTERP